MRPIPIFFCLALAISGCGKPQGEATATDETARLTVAVAASMRFAFEEVAVEFRKIHPQVIIEPSYGASGAFFAQIVQRAPFDIFLSADTEYPERLVAEGHAEAAFPYATGRLVLWARKEAELEVSTRGMGVLKDPRIVRIAIANPQLAPYGRAAEAAMAHHGSGKDVSEKFALAENVGQAAQFVQSGAAQIGFFAYSLTFTPEMKQAGDFWLVPAGSHPAIVQSGVILPWCEDAEAAGAFRDFLLGPEGRAILERHGFGPP